MTTDYLFFKKPFAEVSKEELAKALEEQTKAVKFNVRMLHDAWWVHRQEAKWFLAAIKEIKNGASINEIIEHSEFLLEISDPTFFAFEKKDQDGN